MPPLADLTVTTNRDDLDVRWVIDQLKASYWGGWLTPIQIMRGIDHSLCFGAYIGRKQVGFLRVVTDRATLSSIVDMIVGEGFRGHGVGRRLMEAAIAHTYIAPTMCIIATRDARGFYEKFGFQSVGGDVMKRDPKA